MPDTTTELATLPDFLDAIGKAGIRKVVVRTVREIRPRKLEGHAVEIGPQQWVELSAYAKGALFVASLAGADGDAVERELAGRGLEVTRRSGNIT